jgi:hypothetical protein
MTSAPTSRRKMENGLEHRLDELGRGVAHPPPLGTARLVALGEPLHQRPQPPPVLDHAPWTVGVDDGPDIGAHFVDRDMHHDLRGPLLASGDLVALHIANDQVVRVHHALADARGRTQQTVLVKPNRDIPVVGGHPAFLIHQPSNFDDIQAQFALGLLHSNFRL